MAKKKTQSKAKRKEAATLAGRPAMFQTPDELQTQIDAYFDTCKPTYLVVEGKIVKDKNGNPMIDPNPPTITGLVDFLGFESRTSFYEYGKKQEFMHTVARARTRIEATREKDLCAGRNVDGNKFYLANLAGWRAEQERKHDINVNGGISSFSVDKFLEKFNAK